MHYRLYRNNIYDNFISTNNMMKGEIIMKKTSKIIIALVTVLALGMIVAGCSCSNTDNKSNSTTNTTSNDTKTTAAANNTNTTDNASNSIVGTWKYEKGFDYDADFSYTFNPDGTGVLVDRLGNMNYNFTYQLQGDKIIYTLEGAKPKEFKYSINGNTLIVTDSQGRDIYHTKEK